MRLIDADALCSAFMKRRWDDFGGIAYRGNDVVWYLSGQEIEKIIEDAPTVDLTIEGGVEMADHENMVGPEHWVPQDSDEIEMLRAENYNLRLYLTEVLVDKGVADLLEKRHPGLPGYTKEM